jgi:hypothetical protein
MGSIPSMLELRQLGRSSLVLFLFLDIVGVKRGADLLLYDQSLNFGWIVP